MCCFSILLRSAGEWILYISLEKTSVSFILLFILSLSLHSHMLFWTATLTSLKSLILRDCSICPTCCSHQSCNSLTTPISVYSLSDWWDWPYEGMAAQIYGNPCLCMSPGVLLWWTTLWMSLTSGLDRLPKRRRRQHAPSSPLPCCDDRSLACTGKQKNPNPSDYLSSSCHLFGETI